MTLWIGNGAVLKGPVKSNNNNNKKEKRNENE